MVYLGIGSNLGDREENCEEAAELLGEYGIKVLGRSSMIETRPADVLDQPMFINMVIEAETGLDPRGLLSALHDIERRLGRVRAEKWGPRTVDLDVLLYDDLVMKEPGLEIPHPRMHERDFVLKPLAEIAPDLMHPALGRTVRELYASLERRFDR